VLAARAKQASDEMADAKGSYREKDKQKKSETKGSVERERGGKRILA